MAVERQLADLRVMKAWTKALIPCQKQILGISYSDCHFKWSTYLLILTSTSKAFKILQMYITFSQYENCAINLVNTEMELVKLYTKYSETLYNIT